MPHDDRQQFAESTRDVAASLKEIMGVDHPAVTTKRPPLDPGDARRNVVFANVFPAFVPHHWFKPKGIGIDPRC